MKAKLYVRDSPKHKLIARDLWKKFNREGEPDQDFNDWVCGLRVMNAVIPLAKNKTAGQLATKYGLNKNTADKIRAAALRLKTA